MSSGLHIPPVVRMTWPLTFCGPPGSTCTLPAYIRVLEGYLQAVLADLRERERRP